MALLVNVGAVLFPDSAAALAPRQVELGVSTGSSLLNMEPAALEQRLADIKQMGATWIRVDFTWIVIQPKNSPRFEFYFHDKVVRAAEKAGLKVLGVLTYTPKWARTPQCVRLAGPNPAARQKCAPRSTREFAHFAAMTAQRYRQHDVLAWEIWNEPNLVEGWKDVNKKGELEVNPISYGRFAMLTAEAIRGVSPEVGIVTGGMAPMFEPSPERGMRQSDFLRGMLPYLKSGEITAVGMHPYTWPVEPSYKADWNAFSSVDGGRPDFNLRAILDEAGRFDLPIWGTEYGASTSGAVLYGRAPLHVRADHVDEERQAQIVKEGVQAWYAKARVGPLFVYTDSDQYLLSYKNEAGFGLRRSDGSPKPALDALRDALASTRQ